MNTFWWSMFIVASVLLLYILVRPRLSKMMLLKFMTNLGLAAVVVFVVKITGAIPGVEIVPNIPNVLIAGFLGLPGLAMLYATHLTVLA